MLSASLVSFALGYSTTKSTWALGLLVPCISILPVALLQLSASKLLRRNRGRPYLWVVIFLLLGAIFTLALLPGVSLRGRKHRGEEDQLWESVCLGYQEVEQLVSLGCGLAGLLLLGVTTYLVGSIFKDLGSKLMGPGYATISGWLWWICLLSASSAMWLCLGWFIHFQSYRNRLGGTLNKDTEWTFGQILALATWIPVMVEFAYIWWESPVKAMNGWLMDPYEIKEVSRGPEALELIPRCETD
jgi:hypothetical protein